MAKVVVRNGDDDGALRSMKQQKELKIQEKEKEFIDNFLFIFRKVMKYNR